MTDRPPQPMETIAFRVPAYLKRRIFKMAKWRRQPFCESALSEKFERVDSEKRSNGKGSK